jgi:ferric-dicitrate binding protein FerR (iron transport regulator)
MTREEYKILAGKIASGKATDQEVALYNAWFNKYQVSYNTWKKLPEEQRREMLAETKVGIDSYFGVKVVTRKAKLWPRIAVAAAAVAAITLGTWLYLSEITLSPKASRNDEVVMNDIAPGKNTATLTLADGKVINLDTNKTSVVVADSVKAMTMLTASTPRGGTYQFTLPDGTKVWLNADSKLEFPSQFSGGERKILLEGEAYFEVVHNSKQPFRVESSGQVVEDIGTAFNINAYVDEGRVKTTLVEGEARVHLTGITDKPFRTLTPGQQSVLTDNSRIKIETIDPSEAIAWKEGDIILDADIQTIMRQLSRWYDIEVIYEGKVSEEEFGGTISRNKNISEVLNVLQSTGRVRFKIEGRRVTVMP